MLVKRKKVIKDELRRANCEEVREKLEANVMRMFKKILRWPNDTLVWFLKHQFADITELKYLTLLELSRVDTALYGVIKLLTQEGFI